MAASSSVAQNDIKPIPGLQPGSELFEVLVGDAEIVLKGEDQSTTRDVMLNGERLVIAMIADGHGGKEASAHCKAMVVDELLEGLKVPDGLHVRAAGTHAFLKAHEEVLAMMGTTAGSTLSVIVLNATRAELTVLHCGDSVARLIPRHSAAMGLCEDHRLESSESERARVCAMGGKVARAMDRHGRPSGPVRLWPGGVALARTERSPPSPAIANSSHINSESAHERTLHPAFLGGIQGAGLPTHDELERLTRAVPRVHLGRRHLIRMAAKRQVAGDLNLLCLVGLLRREERAQLAHQQAHGGLRRAAHEAQAQVRALPIGPDDGESLGRRVGARRAGLLA